MVRPAHFGFNGITAESNTFQNKIPETIFTPEQIAEIAQTEFDSMVQKIKKQ